MSDELKEIILAGDVAVDWIGFETKAQVFHSDSQPPLENWKLWPGMRMTCHPGGVLHLQKMLEDSPDNKKRFNISAYKLEDLHNNPPEQIIHSNVILGEYPKKNDLKEKVWRVKRYCGYAGPEIYSNSVTRSGDPENSDLIILDDSGNGFRHGKEEWPKSLKNPNSSPLVIYKMSRKLVSGELWNHVVEKFSNNLILIVNANDLRDEGGYISYCLSWERTVSDILWQLKNNTDFKELTKARHLLIRIGTEGVLYYRKENGIIKADIWYTSKYCEDGIRTVYPGKIQGVSNAFVAGLIQGIISSDNLTFGTIIPEAIVYPWRLYQHGYPQSYNKTPKIGDYNWLYSSAPTKEEVELGIAHISIPDSVIHFYDQTCSWTFLETTITSDIETIASKWVCSGPQCNCEMDCVPVGSWGHLLTVDRSEIESFQSIRNLMQEYLINPSMQKPLCIAVFGPPGSGKSFGVKQLAESIGSKNDIVKLVINLSQTDSPDDLPMYFHRVRDVALNGKTPLVFFDEFDSSLQNKPLGWLKYFLAPMQDGEFRDGEDMHPLGRGIFVFAGGTSESFEDFYDIIRYDVKDAKGTDFISRLKGYVNIKGCNPVDDNDRFYPIRRAILIRSILSEKFPHLITSDTIQIDQAIIRALINVKKYRHGARSLEAIILGSALTGKRFFDKSALPPQDLLSIHVDPEDFMKHLLGEQLLSDTREDLARQIHEDYLHPKEKPISIQRNNPTIGEILKKTKVTLEEQSVLIDDDELKRKIEECLNEHSAKIVKTAIECSYNKISQKKPAEKKWDALTEEYHDSNRRQADDIIRKLRRCEYEVVPNNPATENIENFTFPDEKLEIMSIMEHKRWMAEKLSKGWRFGKERNEVEMIHPSLCSWDKLTHEDKEKDRDSVRNIPNLLKEIGFKIIETNKKGNCRK